MNLFKKLFGKPAEAPPAPVVVETPFDGSRGDVMLAFRQTITGPIDWKDLAAVDFAMWLPTEEDPQFSTSPLLEQWNTLYGLTRNYWSYITADLLRQLDAIHENHFRMSLPDNLEVFAFSTVENEQVVLSLSTEKGIRFHFAATTALDYRLSFLQKFIAYCQAWKYLVTTNDGTIDEDLGFADWWALTVRVCKSTEAEKPLSGVGQIAE